MEKEIRVVFVEPGKCPTVIELGTKLEDMQQRVGGLIDVCYPFDDDVVIVLDDEGKYDGSLPNRALYDEDGKIYDIIFGPFFICDGSGENFDSLSDEQIERYMKMYQRPEWFEWSDGKITVTYDPEAAYE